MRAKTIIKVAAAVIIMATTGCASKKGATSTGRCGSITEPNPFRNQAKMAMKSNDDLTKKLVAFDYTNVGVQR